ncbi:MAG: type II secretion system protein [Acidobacteria bacterium]|nr:MAG: type II secretion system protein [Acidobacteriota bacterium]REK01897.1 MAG: type II secretion system protein [Acidobacteriota bacterium]REK14853.1 MAG: type II secretion system protein [Acidobacteriota bacterium]REK45568.1 MAG: type II secretion system protein [Acidobacteriota bacterium]
MSGRPLTQQTGFSLLELVIAMFILVILISVAVPTYRNSVQHAREVVLQENLFQMRRAIDQYSADKERLPETLQDLVDSNYFREIPIDPMTDEATWDEVLGPDPNSPDAEEGLIDVRSLAEGEDSNGKKYSEY